MSATIRAVIEVYSEEDSTWDEFQGECQHYDVFSRNTKSDVEPFQYMGSSLTAFIGNVRNHAGLPENFEIRGFPEDDEDDKLEDTASISGFYWGCEEPYRYAWYDEGCVITWLNLKELIEFDYEQVFEDLSPPSGSTLKRDSLPKGSGQLVSYREFLGDKFLEDIFVISKYADNPEHVRIVFGLS